MGFGSDDEVEIKYTADFEDANAATERFSQQQKERMDAAVARTKGVFNQLEDTYTVIRTKNTQATADVAGLAGRYQGLGQAGQKAGEVIASGFSSAQSTIITLSSAIQGVRLALSGVESVAGSLGHALDTAFRNEGITNSFKTLQASVGQLSDQSLAKLRTSTKGLVSDLDLMQAANKAVVLGLPINQFDDLAGNAVKLGRAMGKDAAESIELVTQGIGRQSERMLRQLGVFVDANAAYDAYADKNNIVGRELTDVEKKAAFAQTAIEKLAEKAKNAADIADTAGQSYARLKETLENLKNASLEAINQNQNLKKGLDDVNEAAQHVGIIQEYGHAVLALAGYFAQAAGAAIKYAATSTDSILKARDAIDKQVLDKFKSPDQLKQDDMDSFFPPEEEKRNQALLAKRLQDDQTAGAADNARIAAVKKSAQEFLTGLTEEFADKLDITHVLGLDDSKVADISSKVKALVTTFSTGVHSFADLDAAVKKLGIDFNLNPEQQNQLKGQIESAYGRAKTEIDEATKSADKFAATQERIKAALKQSDFKIGLMTGQDPLTVGDGGPGLLESIRQAFKAAQFDGADLTEELKKVRDDFLSSIPPADQNKGIADFDTAAGKIKSILTTLDNQATKLADDVQSNDEKPVKQIDQPSAIHQFAADQLFAGSTTQLDAFTAALSAAAAAASQFVGALSSVYAGFKAGSLGKPGNFVSTGTNVGTLLGGPIGGQFGGVVGQVAQLGHDIFTHTTPGTQDRKAVDHYFDQLFDANHLSIVIGKQVQLATSLAFKGTTNFGNLDFGSGKFSSFLQTLPAEAQNSLNGVGAAFEQLEGVTDKISGQIAAVIADNIGGSLINLQSLVASTGKSFSDLGDAIIESFDNGDLSIQQAQADLEGLRDVFTPGSGSLTDDVNAFQAALDNNKPGQVLFTAIKDIAADAEALHLHTLPDLATYLTDTLHLDAQTVTAFMAAAKAAGLDTFQSILDAGTSTYVALAANAQLIEQGKAPTAVPVTDPSAGKTPATNFTNATLSSPSNTGTTSNGAKQNQAASDAAQKLKQIQQSTLAAFTASKKYAAVLEELKDKTISKSKAEKELADLYAETAKKVKALQDAQDAFTKAQAAGSKISADSLLKLSQGLANAQKAVDNLKGDSINLDFLKPFQDNTLLVGTAISALGETADDASDKIVNMFKAGSLSAQDAAKQIKDTTELLNGGIPNDVGDVNQALRNLLASGTKGGAVSLNAFKGIVSESQEKFVAQQSPERVSQFNSLTSDFNSSRDALESAKETGPSAGESATDYATRMQLLTDKVTGATNALNGFNASIPKENLEDLRSQLLETFDPGTVTKFMTALSDSGVNTFDDLTGASDATRVAIIGDFAQLGGPFAQTSDQITDLLTKLNTLNGSKTNANVNFSVTTTFNNPTTQSIADIVSGTTPTPFDSGGPGNSTSSKLTASQQKDLARLTKLRKQGPLSSADRVTFEKLRRLAK